VRLQRVRQVDVCTDARADASNTPTDLRCPVLRRAKQQLCGLLRRVHVQRRLLLVSE
jgi:hypothetical protein